VKYEDKVANEIAQMTDEQVATNVKEQFASKKGIRWNPKEMLGKLHDELIELRSLYEGVLSRINKLEDDTRAAIEFADLAEDDRGAEMILEFCDDITKLVGE